jgi:hypothetical protein
MGFQLGISRRAEIVEATAHMFAFGFLAFLSLI